MPLLSWRDMVERASQPRSGLLATGVGLAMSALGASGVFGQLPQALNRSRGSSPARSAPRAPPT